MSMYHSGVWPPPPRFSASDLRVPPTPPPAADTKVLPSLKPPTPSSRAPKPGPTSVATDAAAACIKIKGTRKTAEELKEIFKDARLTPSTLVQGCIKAGCALTGLELRGLLTILWDGEGDLEIPSEALLKSVEEAPMPPPTPASFSLKDSLAALTTDPTPTPVQMDQAEVLVVEEDPPPPMMMAPPPSHQPVWEDFEPAPSDLPARQQHEHYTRQTQQAPYATLPVQIAPMFEGGHVRPEPDDKESKVYFDPKMSAAARAAFLAQRKGLGYAGKSSLTSMTTLSGGSTSRPSSSRAEAGSAQEALLMPPRVKPSTPALRPPTTPPYGLDYATGPLASLPPQPVKKLSEMAKAAVGAGQTKAPYATLSAEQLGQLSTSSQFTFGWS